MGSKKGGKGSKDAEIEECETPLPCCPVPVEKCPPIPGEDGTEVERELTKCEKRALKKKKEAEGEEEEEPKCKPTCIPCFPCPTKREDTNPEETKTDPGVGPGKCSVK